MKIAPTKYGVRIGNVTLEALAEHRGYQLFRVRTDRQCFNITVTPTGLIRRAEVSKTLEWMKKEDP